MNVLLRYNILLNVIRPLDQIPSLVAVTTWFQLHIVIIIGIHKLHNNRNIFWRSCVVVWPSKNDLPLKTSHYMVFNEVFLTRCFGWWFFNGIMTFKKWVSRSLIKFILLCNILLQMQGWPWWLAVCCWWLQYSLHCCGISGYTLEVLMLISTFSSQCYTALHRYAMPPPWGQVHDGTPSDKSMGDGYTRIPSFRSYW